MYRARIDVLEKKINDSWATKLRLKIAYQFSW